MPSKRNPFPWSDVELHDWKDLWTSDIQPASVGSIFTRPEIVRLILDLADYRVGSGRLAEQAVLEPSCGDGAFLAEIVDRLIASELSASSPDGWDDVVLDNAIRATDIDLRSLDLARTMIVERLVAARCPYPRAEQLACTWTVHTDFLLSEWDQRFDLIVGNPPYVRIEELPKRVLNRYRELFTTTSDRADLYVAFFEKGLELLTDTGTLAFICANRFTKNKYGAKLRKLIAQSFHVRYYLNLEHTQPFLQDVSAYPAIIVIDREREAPTHAATLDDITPSTLESVRVQALNPMEAGGLISVFSEWYPNGEAWTSTSRRGYSRLLSLQERHPTLEESGCGTRVGIGVATGADSVFVLSGKHPDIESSRQLPLLMSCDIGTREITWTGSYLINPFDDCDNGSLVDLEKYPGLKAYFEQHESQLRGRHVARARPHAWYRTIDRIWPSLLQQPKLVIPDIQSGGMIGIDRGEYYPHHNLYWITSESWNLDALKALLRSNMVRSQVEAYSVQMRGGSIRYQAQTLRKIRIPCLANLPSPLIEQLAAVASSDDQEVIDALAYEAFTV